MISLHGTIPDPLNGDAFYILKEEKLSETLWRYTGRIGFGETAEEYLAREPHGDCAFHTDFHIPYRSFDMTYVQFLYDTAKNTVHMECSLRGQVMAEEAASIPNNITYELPTYEELANVMHKLYKDMSPSLSTEDIRETMLDLQVSAKDWKETTDSYLYFRCPRSKDGVALTRAMAYILRDRPPFQIMYPLILDA
jgi:hypothetical protein